MLDVGPASIPAILNAIVDQALNLSDLSQVWDVHWIVDDRLRGWTSHADVDLIPFASDCMGNIFGFAVLTSDRAWKALPSISSLMTSGPLN